MELRVVNLHKSYATQEVLRAVNFQARSGQVIGFLGVNGAGKSTTMRILCGILRADSGQVYLDDREISQLGSSISQQIGYLSEHNPLYGDLFVWEYLDFIAQVRKIPKRRQVIHELLERLGIIEERKKKLEQLSKGYRQRVGLLAALIHQPQILILDEPTSGLDPRQMREIRTLISEFGKQRIVILSSHVLQEVTHICNHILIIHQGKIVLDSPRNQLESWSVQASWRTQVSAAELMPLAKYCQEIRAVAPADSDSSAIWLFYPKQISPNASANMPQSLAELQRIIREFSQAKDWNLLSLTENQDELESIFQRVTGI